MSKITTHEFYQIAGPFDTPCGHCGKPVHEAGAPLCDDCDPEKIAQRQAVTPCDDTIPWAVAS